MRKKSIMHRLFLILLFPLSLMIVYFAKSNAAFVEKYYSNGIYPKISKLLSFITSFTKYSVFEFLVYFVVIFSICYLLFIIIRLLTKGEKVYNFIKSIMTLCAIFSVFYFCFTIFWTINYYRKPLNSQLNYDVRPSSALELKSMCDKLTILANEHRSELEYDDDTTFYLSSGKEDSLSDVHDIINKIEWLRGYSTVPKQVLASKGLSKLNITGIYSPFTAEANVNMDIPDLTFMATACHEASHLVGFAREDEANYIAWYSIMNGSEITEYKYSAIVHALIYSTNALYDTDKELYREVRDNYSKGLQHDLVSHKEYWNSFDTKAAEVQETMNDYYLKSNSQTDGVKSYGRMVDLLLGEFRQNNFDY